MPDLADECFYGRRIPWLTTPMATGGYLFESGCPPWRATERGWGEPTTIRPVARARGRDTSSQAHARIANVVVLTLS